MASILPAVILFLGLADAPKPIRVEAETGRLTGASVVAKRAGYSGTGYITGLTRDGDRAEWRVTAPAGLYGVRIRYSAPMGEKGYVLVVNGAKYSGMLAVTGDVFATQPAGKVELIAGENTLAIEKGWGYYDVDYVELVPARPAPMPRRLSRRLSDPGATREARALMGRLAGHYGRGTVSGQYELSEVEYVRQMTGRTPVILGGDLMDYSPSRLAYGARPGGTTERWIQAARSGYILTLSWHWNAPKDLLDKTYRNDKGETVDARWYKGFYTYATGFDIRKALADRNGEEYRLLLRDIDAIARQLRKLSDARVPVLFRPLHEAEGGWFWWGARGPEMYKKLWRLMYDRLTRRHGLHNLLWVHNCVRPEWYPGDDVVDIVGVDVYPDDPGDPLGGLWETLQKRFDGRKLLAVTEFGGVPDVRKMHRFGARWSYFVSWTGSSGPRKMDRQALRELYNNKIMINRERW